MKKLPGTLVVFNGTPHPVDFFCARCYGAGEYESSGNQEICPDCQGCGYVRIESDAVISASISEEAVETTAYLKKKGLRLVKPIFCPTDDGREIIRAAYADGADVVIGSLIAAQAYPGEVVALIPALGYERRPPAKKRMRQDKFTVMIDDSMTNT